MLKSRTCEVCGGDYKPRRTSQKYCNQKCRGIGLTKKPTFRSCTWCNGPFSPIRESQKFCSRSCGVRFYRDQPNSPLVAANKKYSSVKAGYRKRRFGITEEIFDAFFESQNGACAICQKHQSKLKRTMAVDHCHKTGKIRGLLCLSCNMAIGQLKDSTDLLTRAIEYLQKNR